FHLCRRLVHCTCLPTRRSSVLVGRDGLNPRDFVPAAWNQTFWDGRQYALTLLVDPNFALVWKKDAKLGSTSKVSAYCRPSQKVRSEEHTSELQSREKLVCRLLL